MIEQLIEMLEQTVSSPKLFELLAKGYATMLHALIREGFTRDEALKIISSRGLGFSKS